MLLEVIFTLGPSMYYSIRSQSSKPSSPNARHQQNQRLTLTNHFSFKRQMTDVKIQSKNMNQIKQRQHLPRPSPKPLHLRRHGKSTRKASDATRSRPWDGGSHPCNPLEHPAVRAFEKDVLTGIGGCFRCFPKGYLKSGLTHSYGD